MLFVVNLFMVCFLSIVSTSTALSLSDAPHEEKNQLRLLFTQAAEEVTLLKSASHPEEWTLTLKNVEPDLLYFSEKPWKLAGKISIEDFIADWSVGNRNSASGALITHFSHLSAEGGCQNRQIIISNPKFDRRHNTISYHVENPARITNLYEGTHKNPMLFIEKY